ncbi:MAG: isoprenyl transferase [Candidatus Omnitrophica bacterium]|nr:isoprenyl transferase [Candidatus Omnitrophota bacterium]
MLMALPRHIAIIMDGNGRWARRKGLNRIMGHRSGAKTADKITEACARRGIEALTLYTFSTENWKRPKKEVDALMGLIERTLSENEKKIKSNNIRFNVIGRIDELVPSLRERIRRMMADSSSNSGMVLTLALNYGSRQEILEAAKKACEKSAEKGIGQDVFSEEYFSGLLYTSDLPDPDFVIRTSGEMRLSNFLLWQTAYAEIYVTDTLWPDFSADELDKALEDYQRRDRRFGE